MTTKEIQQRKAQNRDTLLRHTREFYQERPFWTRDKTNGLLAVIAIGAWVMVDSCVAKHRAQEVPQGITLRHE